MGDGDLVGGLLVWRINTWDRFAGVCRLMVGGGNFSWKKKKHGMTKSPLYMTFY